MPLSLKEPLNDRNWEKLSGSSAADLYSALGKARLLLNLPVPELTAMQLCIKFGCVSIHERIHRAHRDISEGLVRGERGGTSLSRTKPILMTQAQLNVVQVVVFMSVCKVVGMTKEVTVARLCQLACCSKIEFNRTRKVLESDTTFKRVMEDVAKDREAIRNAKAVVKKRKRAVNDVDVNEQENRDVDDVAERPPVNGIHSMIDDGRISRKKMDYDAWKSGILAKLQLVTPNELEVIRKHQQWIEKYPDAPLVACRELFQK